MRRFVVPLLAFLTAGLVAVRAQTAVAPTSVAPKSVTETSPKNENPEEFSRVQGLFDVDLPKTVEKFAAKLTVHPHFGDLLHRDYIRIPVGIRLGLTDNLEINSQLEGYVTHGLKKGRAGNGLDNYTFGAKYQWKSWLKEYVDTSSGFNVSVPLGHPPLDLTDGHVHFGPYVTFSKQWPGRPNFTPFVSLGTDFLWKSSVRGSFAKNAAHSDSMGISPGFFYDAGKLKYTLTTGYWTTALIGHGTHNFYSVSPSVLWELPPWLTFHSESQWIFGFGVKVLIGPEGTDVSSSGKLRGEFKFMRAFGRGK